MLEARAPAGDELTTYEDGRHHPVARHSLHDVHHHLPVLPLLVHLHALKLCAQVIQCPLQSNCPSQCYQNIDLSLYLCDCTV